MISSAARLGQDMVHFHNLEGKVGVAAHAFTFLLTVEPMTVSTIIRQIAEISALRCLVDDVCAAPKFATIFTDTFVDQFYRKWRKINACPLTLHAVGSNHCCGTPAEGI